ncbi:MAG: alpha/beta hydrolase, partial [Eudoraea sp.]
HMVTAPTLLIVGGWDKVVIILNQKAYSKLRCERKLEIIPGATHLFEESGKLEEVAALSAKWFTKHLKSKRPNNV